MKTSRWVESLVLTALLAATAACQSPATPERIAGPFLKTVGTEYTFVPFTDIGLTVEIPFTYSNVTADTIYFPRCGHAGPTRLERWDGSDWVYMWVASDLACLGPPLVIAPGETYSHTLRITGAYPWKVTPYHTYSTVFPPPDEIPGLYRLIWGGLVHGYAHESGSWGNPLPSEYITSNTFLLRVE